MLIRAVGGGVERSSVTSRGVDKSGRNSFAKSVARYSFPARGSNSLVGSMAEVVIVPSIGVRGYTS